MNARPFLVIMVVLGLLCAEGACAVDMDKIDVSKMRMESAVRDKYSFMAQPYSFYYFHNMDKLGLKLDWARKGGHTFQLQGPEEDLTLSYTFGGKEYSLDEYFSRNSVLGFLVLRDDRIIFEKYFHGADASSRFISNSVIKSFVSVLVGVAVEEGKIKSVDDPVGRYLPYLADSGFKDATVRDVLRMASGVKWDEDDYLAPGSDFNSYLTAQLRGEPSFKDLEASCRSKEKPGKQFEYQSIDTQVLGELIEAATGMPLNKYLEEKLWKRIGAESDAFFYRSSAQPQVPAAVGFNAVLRDYARFGLMAMHGGSLGGERIVSEAWMRDSTEAGGASWEPQPAGDGDEFAENVGYGYQWWLIHGKDRVFMALGIYGQAIYIDPARHVVIVQASAWPEPDPDANWNEMIKVMDTISRKISPLH